MADNFPKFPRTTVGGISVSRMIIGTNWMLGYSHTSPAADQLIQKHYQTPEDFQAILDAYLKYGIDTIMAPISTNPKLVEAIRMAEERWGHKMILVDTPNICVDDTEEGRRQAWEIVKKSKEVGSDFCLMHHSRCEQLVNKHTRTIDRLDDYTYMIREAGMVPGLSCHMPEIIPYVDENGYDIETYIQIFNAAGFLMQVEIESVARIIQNAKKPVMNIKAMAAGRLTPYVGLTFNWNVLRPCDMLTLGAFNAQEVDEDVEISLAALEHRFPALGRRSSPAPDQVAFGNGK